MPKAMRAKRTRMMRLDMETMTPLETSPDWEWGFIGEKGCYARVEKWKGGSPHWPNSATRCRSRGVISKVASR